MSLMYATCKNCLEWYCNHVENKCIYHHTYYETACCMLCSVTERFMPSYAYIKNTYYFLCTECDVTYVQSVYRDHRASKLTEAKQSLLEIYRGLAKSTEFP